MAMNDEKKNALTEEVEQYEKEHTMETIRAKLVAKNAFKNLDRYLNTQRTEIEYDTKEQQRVSASAMKEKKLENEEKLAMALDKVKRKEICELKMRQHLRENNHELRALESKLKAAYVTQELTTQIAEKEAKKLIDQLQDKYCNEKLESARIKQEELNKQLAEAELKKKLLYKQELQDQMILQEKNKRYKYEEFLREKKMLDDIIQRIHDEDERDYQDKTCKMLKTRQEMVAFKTAQEVWRKKHREELDMENRRIQEYLLTKAATVKAKEQERERKEAIKMQISEKIAKQIYDEQAKKKEREEIIQELLQEEQKEAVEKRHREEVAKELRQKQEVRESLTRQMEEREERRRQEALEDSKYKEQLIAKIAEDQKLEQLTAQKKRLKMIQIRKEVEQMMMQRRQNYAEEMQLNMRLIEEAKKEEEEKRRIVEEERMRMLKKHANNLIGFIPPGVLREDDLPHLGTSVLEAYGKQNGKQT